MKTTILAVALALSLCACVLFAYLWIDRSITLTYVSAGNVQDAAATRQLEMLLGFEWQGLTEKEVLQKLQIASEKLPTAKILQKKEESVIWFDLIPFNFQDGKLVSVGNN